MKTMGFGFVGLLAVLLVPSMAEAQSAGRSHAKKGGCCCKKRGEGHGLGQRERHDGDRTGFKDELARHDVRERRRDRCTGDDSKRGARHSMPPVRKDGGPTPKPVKKGNNGVGNGQDPQPPGNPPVNDGPGTGPGNPGNK